MSNDDVFRWLGVGIVCIAVCLGLIISIEILNLRRHTSRSTRTLACLIGTAAGILGVVSVCAAVVLHFIRTEGS